VTSGRAGDDGGDPDDDGSDRGSNDEDMLNTTSNSNGSLRLKGKREARSYEEGTLPKAGKKDPLSRYSRHWTRTHEMWVRFGDIIDLGTNNEPGHLRYKTLLQELKEVCPILDVAIKKRGVPDVASAMERARNNARREDIKRLKDNINKIFRFSTPLGDAKETRGFHNLEVGELLLPPDLASRWRTDHQLRQRYQQGLEAPNVRNYGIWMYQYHTADPDNLLGGFLRSDGLVRGFHMLFHGPSAVDGRGLSARATKKGNAQLNSMYKVTVASIAYVAALLRFALDSAPTFSVGGTHGTFDYHAFYNSLINLLTMPELQGFREELLRWWNQQVFPNQEPEQADDDDTVYAQMLAQVGATAAP